MILAGLGQLTNPSPVFRFDLLNRYFHANKGSIRVNKAVYIPPYEYTPFFPAWRSKLAAFGRRAQTYRRAAEVEPEFSGFLPRALLAQAERGAGSRKRIFTRMSPF
jgi:hypothetical protein